MMPRIVRVGVLRGRTALRLIAVVAMTTALGLNSSAEAQQKTTRTLGRGGKLTVFANRCALRQLPSSNLRTQRIRCEGRVGRRRSNSNRNTVVLNTRQQLTVFARSCFLSLTRNRPARINVQCTRRRPTPTPTATPEATATPTVTPTPSATPTVNANALLSSNRLIEFSVDNPAAASTPSAITGVNVGDEIVAIDRRPQNGLLYGLGYNAGAGTVQLYAISSETNIAVAIGTAGQHVAADGTTPVRIGTDANTRFGFDFNPTVDRIRVVTSDGPSGAQNFRINPNNGALVDGNLGVTGATPTPDGLNQDGGINGSTNTVQETAYANSEPNTTVTTQFTIDSTQDLLCIQNPPNTGTQTGCVALSRQLDTMVGFDIPRGVNVPASSMPPTSGSGVILTRLTGNSVDGVATVDLTNGTVSTASTLGDNTADLRGLALSTANGVDVIALAGDGQSLLRFNSATTGSVTTVAITGVTIGETLVGIDIRPATGQLYGLGINAGDDNGTIYLIDPQSGVATAVGTPGAIAFVDVLGDPIDFPVASAGWGVDFNPQVDRFRVVAGTGLNFRINQINGTPVDSDGDPLNGVNPDGTQNGQTTSSTGAAYTNSFQGTTATTLYTIDAASDALYIQNPPNNGTQTNVIPLTVNGSSIDFTAVNGFDIPRNVRVATGNAAVTEGTGYAVLTVGGVTGLYAINLPNGVSTSLGAIGTGAAPIAGFTIGQLQVR